jgi:hypothetical protein
MSLTRRTLLSAGAPTLLLAGFLAGRPARGADAPPAPGVDPRLISDRALGSPTAQLVASQDHWAFAQGVDSMAELAKMAALAGLSQDSFHRVTDDQALRQALIDKQDGAQKKYGIDSTPSFIFGGTLFSGEMDYDTFAKKVSDAGG